MTAFTLDTSGEVPAYYVKRRSGTVSAWRWSDLDPFTQGYIEALFASLRDAWADKFAASHGGAKNPHFKHPGFSDLAPETLARIMEVAELAAGLGAPNTVDAGARHWAIEQSDGRPPFPRRTPYLGDDGLVRFKEAA
jgi:hypothetical protein